MKYSLHIGLNFVDAFAYNGWDGKLADCITDMENMEALANQNGYATLVLPNSHANYGNVKRTFDYLAKTANTGDRVLITYSGHGSNYEDDNGDELDGRDEVWCLYNGGLRDDELNAWLAKFKAGVEVLLLSDSCHSGTMSRAMPTQKKTKALVMVEPKASVLLISGCQDPEYSASTGKGGAFTLAFLKAWTKKEAVSPLQRLFNWILPPKPTKPNLGELYEQILRNVKGQKPNWYETGAKTNWGTKSVF